MANFVTTLFDDRKNPGKVTVGLLMAMNAAKKGHTVTVVLMMDSVRLAVPGGLDGIEVGPPFKPARELYEMIHELGGKVLACASCLEYAKLTKDQLEPRVGVVAAPEVIDLLTGAQGTFQVT